MSEEEVPDGIYIEFAGSGGRGGVVRAFRRVSGVWYRLAQYTAGPKVGELFELASTSDEANKGRDDRVRDGIYVRLDGERGEILG